VACWRDVQGRVGREWTTVADRRRLFSLVACGVVAGCTGQSRPRVDNCVADRMRLFSLVAWWRDVQGRVGRDWTTV
jgi:hypothetical protein